MKLRSLRFSLFAVVVVITGCATNSQEEIDYYGQLFYFSNMCADAGMLDQETAAKGTALANSHIYASDTKRYRAKAMQMYQRHIQPTPTQCNVTKRQIMGAEYAESIKSNTPTKSQSLPLQTSCSTYFGQTHCTTY